MAVLSHADVRLLREMIAWYKTQKTIRKQPKQTRPGRRAGGGAAINIQAPDAGIPARVGTRLGRATCKILDSVLTGDEIDLIDSGITVEVYNTVTLIVLDGGEGIGQALMNSGSGKFEAIVGDCNDTTNEGGGPGGA